MREYVMAPGEFAKHINVDIKTYSAWENNHSRPTLERAIVIANKLNKDIKEIWYVN